MKKDPIQNYVKAENYGIDQQMAQMDFSAAFKVIGSLGIMDNLSLQVLWNEWPYHSASISMIFW